MRLDLLWKELDSVIMLFSVVCPLIEDVRDTLIKGDACFSDHFEIYRNVQDLNLRYKLSGCSGNVCDSMVPEFDL